MSFEPALWTHLWKGEGSPSQLIPPQERAGLAAHGPATLPHSDALRWRSGLIASARTRLLARAGVWPDRGRECCTGRVPGPIGGRPLVDVRAAWASVARQSG